MSKKAYFNKLLIIEYVNCATNNDWFCPRDKIRCTILCKAMQIISGVSQFHLHLLSTSGLCFVKVQS